MKHILYILLLCIPAMAGCQIMPTLREDGNGLFQLENKFGIIEADTIYNSTLTIVDTTDGHHLSLIGSNTSLTGPANGVGIKNGLLFRKPLFTPDYAFIGLTSARVFEIQTDNTEINLRSNSTVNLYGGINRMISQGVGGYSLIENVRYPGGTPQYLGHPAGLYVHVTALNGLYPAEYPTGWAPLDSLTADADSTNEIQNIISALLLRPRGDFSSVTWTDLTGSATLSPESPSDIYSFYEGYGMDLKYRNAGGDDYWGVQADTTELATRAYVDANAGGGGITYDTAQAVFTGNYDWNGDSIFVFTAVYNPSSIASSTTKFRNISVPSSYRLKWAEGHAYWTDNFSGERQGEPLSSDLWPEVIFRAYHNIASNFFVISLRNNNQFDAIASVESVVFFYLTK